MAIELKGSAVDQLREIARMAYGSGMTEGTRGGEGNIGMIGNHVVKFNTHRSERNGKANFEMVSSGDQLKDRILDLVSEALAGKTDEARREEIKSSLLRLMATENAANGVVTAKSLLTRRVVAAVINTVQDELNAVRGKDPEVDLWSDCSAADASKDIQTDFKSVEALTRPITGAQVRAQQRLAKYLACAKKCHPLEDVGMGKDGKLGQHVEFLTGLLRSDENTQINLRTRADFARALCDLFEVRRLEDLPGSVKDVLKIGDFNDHKGHPLSVHRVEEIMAAVRKTVFWSRAEPSDPKELESFRADPFSILETTKPLVYDFNEAHLTHMKVQLKEDVHKYVGKDVFVTDKAGTLGAMALDLARGFKLVAEGVPFEGQRDMSLNAENDTHYHRQVCDALDTVFRNPDGTVDEKSRNAFIRIANQNIVANLYWLFNSESPKTECPMSPASQSDEVRQQIGIEVSRGDKPGTYRMVYFDSKAGFDTLLNQQYEPQPIDVRRNNSRTAYRMEMVFTTDENGELEILDVPLARGTLDFSLKTVA